MDTLALNTCVKSACTPWRRQLQKLCMLEIICVEDSCWRLSALRLSGGGDSCVVLRVRLENALIWRCRCFQLCLDAGAAVKCAFTCWRMRWSGDVVENALIWRCGDQSTALWYMMVSLVEDCVDLYIDCSLFHVFCIKDWSLKLPGELYTLPEAEAA